DGAGHIVGISASVKISALSIANQARTTGEFHDLTAALMGGVANGRAADASILRSAVASEALRLIGSKGNDKATGTQFSDIMKGGKGNDVLNGGDGNDKLYGQAGNDKLYGGL